MSGLFAVSNLGKKRAQGEGWLFRHISFVIEEGELWYVKGPSGSGKTTLLRCLAHLEASDEGRVNWNELALAGRVPQYRKKVAYLRQKACLWGKTVKETLLEPFTFQVNRGDAFDETLALELFSTLGFSGEILEKDPSRLSGGESQVVAFVRALLLHPQGLLLDEPDSALDPQRRKLFRQYLELWLRQPKHFIVMVSHETESHDGHKILLLGER